jgi:hypothetical protein
MLPFLTEKGIKKGIATQNGGASRPWAEMMQSRWDFCISNFSLDPFSGK